jgi:endonuclease YncB( thermonuclease family)
MATKDEKDELEEAKERLDNQILKLKRRGVVFKTREQDRFKYK